jgi:subtilisin-like proprotein convertase family protein
MAKIRFWKWQYTDDFGTQRVTRHLVSGADARQRLGEPANGEWPLEIRDRKQTSPNELLQSAPK